MSTDATLFDAFRPGDIFMKAPHTDRSNPMALYRFDGWNSAPASTIGGRLADATWLYNGTRSGAWERDMTPLTFDEIEAAGFDGTLRS